MLKKRTAKLRERYNELYQNDEHESKMTKVLHTIEMQRILQGKGKRKKIVDGETGEVRYKFLNERLK